MGQPKSPSENPVPYKVPSVPYEDISIGTLDKERLRGWICK